MICCTDPKRADTGEIRLSVVVPVFNEEENLEELHQRLTRTLENIGYSYEVIFVDDGSSDASTRMLHRMADGDERTVIVTFNRNYGQHAAVMAGLEQSVGEVVVTLDADLQNPPEEIPRLVEKIDEGYDVVGTRRKRRKDSAFRRLSSKMTNRVMGGVLKAPMRDYGCMLRAYRRDIVESICRCNEISTFVPALAVRFAANPTEIRVAHEQRHAGKTKYPFHNLIMLLLDLVTGFSMLPLRLMTVFGILVSVAGTGFGFFLLIRRLVVGPEVEGVFTLFSLLFVFIGLLFFAMGLMGEYIGRIYAEVRHRPRFLIKEVYGKRPAGKQPTVFEALTQDRRGV
ncbi:MAG: glycosyltransferase [Planctomycetota bacterium]